jgi:hypothetical protein
VNTVIVGSDPVPPTVPSTTVPATTTTVPKGPLPRSGGTPLPLLLLALGATCVGGSLLLARRRI